MPSAVPASFRDPAGYVVQERGLFKRIVTTRGQEDYRYFLSSGLSERLIRRGLVVSYYEEEGQQFRQPGVQTVLVPEQVPVHLLSIRMVFRATSRRGATHFGRAGGVARLRHVTQGRFRLQRPVLWLDSGLHRSAVVRTRPWRAVGRL